jgi:hypothetical protein
MCLSRSNPTPETPEPPAPAPAPASSITPQLDTNKKTKSGEIYDRAKGKRKFRVDSKKKAQVSYGSMSGLNIPS